MLAALENRMGSATLFPVEIRLVERTEDALTTRISAIQEWLDDRGFEPSTFRYTFFDAGILLRVDFNLESEAIAFANKFSGLGAYLGETRPAYRHPKQVVDGAAVEW